MDGFKVTIKECTRELSAREKIRLKDTSNAIKLDTAVTADERVMITPVAYAILSIHNEKSDNKDYENIVIEDKNGDKYVTGSPSFTASFFDIWDEMDGTGEEFSIEVYKMDSKNYKGKQFLTCSIL